MRAGTAAGPARRRVRAKLLLSPGQSLSPTSRRITQPGKNFYDCWEQSIYLSDEYAGKTYSKLVNMETCTGRMTDLLLKLKLLGLVENAHFSL